MQLNEVQVKMLEEMLTWCDGYDNFVHPYSKFEILIDGRMVMKPELRKNMTELRKMDLVEITRGGLNEDGEVVGGTAFSIIYSKQNEVRELLSHIITRVEGQGKL